VKPILMEILRDEGNDFRRRSMAREYLQARILLALQDHGAFANWAFVGGTALRFLFQLPRYSENLDFALTAPGTDARFEKFMESVRCDLAAEGYDVAVRARTRATVASALVKFRGLLYELGLSPHDDEVFTVKVEIDTNPPDGAQTETILVRRFVMLNLLHYDRASLMAGKLHAVLMRTYTKGRDLYDLAWYLADPGWPAPNLTQLNNALQQTGWDGAEATPANWRGLVRDKLATVDWKQVLQDVTPFLERRKDAALVSRDTILSLLGDG
jgi:predicted nucleotidyltransferase component of viral defense system